MSDDDAASRCNPADDERTYDCVHGCYWATCDDCHPIVRSKGKER